MRGDDAKQRRTRLVVAFDGGVMTSDAGALLLRETDRAIDLIERVARCFEDGRAGDRVVHTVADSGDRGLTGCTKKLISVSLEMRVDSKHCNVGILALSGR